MFEDLIHGPKSSVERLEKIPMGRSGISMAKHRFQINALKREAQASKPEDQLFKNVNVYFTGYTGNVNVNRLIDLLHKYGGKTTFMLSVSKNTHLVCTSLCASKIRVIANSKRKIHVVHPNWILESVKRGKLAAENEFEVVSFSAQHPKLLYPNDEKKEIKSNNQRGNSELLEDLESCNLKTVPSREIQSSSNDSKSFQLNEKIQQCSFKPVNHPLMRYRRSSKSSPLHWLQSNENQIIGNSISKTSYLKSKEIDPMNPSSKSIKQKRLEKNSKLELLASLPLAQNPYNTIKNEYC